MANEKIFKRGGKMFKHLNFEDGDVLLVRWHGRTREEQDQITQGMKELADNILATSGKSIIIIAVEEIADIGLLSDIEMRKWGWVRADTVMAYKDDLFEELAEREDIT